MRRDITPATTDNSCQNWKEGRGLAEGDEERGQPTKLGSLPPAPPLPSFVALWGCVRAYTVPGKERLQYQAHLSRGRPQYRVRCCP